MSLIYPLRNSLPVFSLTALAVINDSCLDPLFHEEFQNDHPNPIIPPAFISENFL